MSAAHSMTKGERRFLALTPVPLVLAFYHVIPVLSWFTVALAWIPQTVGSVLSLVLLVAGIRLAVRALWQRRYAHAGLLVCGTLVGGVLALGFLWIFVAISLNMFSIHP